ncbi:MAG TPA: 23S rRNA (pseudouridine(1915)-N(3))-methyltransferase RlmH [Firmicutes bacterium]|jgi:23S rRNA (pseudouridine1915-N3)-methyltransferase|nr:23S rRNA (pseudouridine(1915)-N(3))-methyltransferase RlmH [Bacillota bacterium]
MQITIIAVGSLREKYWRQAALEYERRLLPYVRLRVHEIAPERAHDENSEAEIAQVLQKEGAKIRKALPRNHTLVALDVKGRAMSSPELAQWLEQEATYGRGSVTMLIGGSYGLEPSLLAEADLRLSFSAFTFPHQLMRIILLEQLYRAMKIQRGEAYHK